MLDAGKEHGHGIGVLPSGHAGKDAPLGLSVQHDEIFAKARIRKNGYEFVGHVVSGVFCLNGACINLIAKNVKSAEQRILRKWGVAKMPKADRPDRPVRPVKKRCYRGAKCISV